MASEREKMLAGELYNAFDPELMAARDRAHDLCRAYNATAAGDVDLRARLLRELIPASGEDLYIEPPFYCDYGSNITFGRKVYFNYNCVILDVARVTVGDNTMFAPGVQLAAATHPVDAATRRSGLELGKPIAIGSDVWVGAGAIVCPGVRIGDRSVIGAGSVVTRDIPSDVVAVGNPCRVIRSIVG